MESSNKNKILTTSDVSVLTLCGYASDKELDRIKTEMMYKNLSTNGREVFDIIRFHRHETEFEKEMIQLFVRWIRLNKNRRDKLK